MRNSLLLFILLTYLAACAPAVATPAGTDTPAIKTPIPSLTGTPKPTGTIPPTASPTLQRPEINPATSSTLWPAEVQARFSAVLTDPWTATADQKATYDAYLTTQWQLTLKAEGVANAETLTGYNLLNAIIDHLPEITLTGNETPEQLAGYVVELPFSLHKLIRTDQNNLVGFHYEPGRYVQGHLDKLYNSNPPAEYQGPLQKVPNDWGYAHAWWGLGSNWSPLPTHDELVTHTNNWLKPGNFGFQFYGEKIPAATDRVSVDGDMMFLFRIPGTDPNAAVGVMMRIYDGSQIRYTEAFLPLSTVTTTQTDTCILDHGAGVILTVESCPAEYIINQASMRDSFSMGTDKATLDLLLKLMSLYKNPHITTLGRGTNSALFVWKDGIPVFASISTPNLPQDFFTK
jgi:hypothetical protein